MSPVDLIAPSERSPYAGVRHVDLSGESVQLQRGQWNPRKVRERGDMRGIILHQWDTPVGTTAANRARFGEAEALARRALKTPYTICAGVTAHGGEPVVVLAHPLERYTFASDAACTDWLAIGVMGQFAFDDEQAAGRDLTAANPAMALAVGAAIDLAVRLLAGSERDAGPYAMITHRQAINGRGDHRECPGEAVVRMALQSEAVRRGVVVPDPDLVLVEDWGRPWPDPWRRHLPTFAAPPSTTTAPQVSKIALPPLPRVPVVHSGDETA